MCIGADYSAICEPIWFFFGTLMSLHVLHILLVIQVNMLIVFQVI